MKIYLLIICFLLTISRNLLSQEIDTALSEGQQVKFCGKVIMINEIWIDKGIIKTDISILENENRKPVTGSYKIMDKLIINDSCVLYVNNITKQGFYTKEGINHTSSRVRISNAPNVYTSKTHCLDNPLFIKGSEYILISFELFQWSIKETHEDEEIPFAEIKEKSRKISGSLFLKEKDLLWWETCLYELMNIREDSLIFRKVNSYSYSEHK